MFSEQHVREIRPRLKQLESIEPLLAVWSSMGGRIRNSPPAPWVRLLWDAQDVFLSWKQLSKPKKGQIVAVTSAMSPSMMGSIRAVLKELKEMGRPAFVVTNPRTREILHEQLHDGSADIKEMIASHSYSKKKVAREKAYQLADSLRELVNDKQVGAAEIWIERALLLREAATRWLGNTGAIIMASDSDPERKAFALAARENGIPSIVLQHGMLGSREIPIHADRMYCWGTFFCKQAEGFGMNPIQALAMGCPRFDHLETLRRSCGTENREQIDKPHLLVISSAHASRTYPDLYRGFFRAIAALVDAGISVAIKLHPAEKSQEIYRKHLAGDHLTKIRFLPCETNLYAALLESSAAYHVQSAAALETMLLGVPILTHKPSSTEQKLTEFPDLGGGVWVDEHNVTTTFLELAKKGSVRSAVLDRQDQFLQHAFVNKGHATKAVAQRLVAAPL